MGCGDNGERNKFLAHTAARESREVKREGVDGVEGKGHVVRGRSQSVGGLVGRGRKGRVEEGAGLRGGKAAGSWALAWPRCRSGGPREGEGRRTWGKSEAGGRAERKTMARRD